MIEFAWPWVFAALPLPLLIRWLLPAADPGGGAALRVPVLDDFRLDEPGRATRPASRAWRLPLAALAWLLLVLATARPQWLGDPIELPVSGRDLMLAVDLSGSMRETDFVLAGQRVNRLTATKQVAGDFIERRVGDRLGLILFGEQAYLQAPLSFDRETVRSLLDEAAIGLAGAEATAIGDAIGLGVKRLRNVEQSSRVLILLTDGVNNAGAVEPLKAAELAAEIGLKIYTIGIGADEALVRGLFGTRRVNPSRDLDEKTLEAIAQRTGGRYFRARDSQELTEIYALLDRLEPVEQDRQVFRPTHALFVWPLGGALILAALLLLPSLSPTSRSPTADAR
jgi:Ca-activated chloride channel family protein